MRDRIEVRPLLHEERTFSFLRLPSAIARRRARPWLTLLRRSLRASLVVGLLVMFVGWLYSSPVFALRGLSIEGNERVPRPWVEQVVSDWRGTNLLLLDLQQIQRRLLEHRWIEAVELQKRLPDHLAIHVHEHHPVALLVGSGAPIYVGAEGELIAPAEGPPESLLSIRSEGPRTGAPLHRALLGALRTVRVLPGSPLAWAGRVREIVLLGDQDYEVRLEGLDFPLVLREDTRSERLALFDQLLPAIEHELGGLELADLRLERRIVVRPAPAPSTPNRENVP